MNAILPFRTREDAEAAVPRVRTHLEAGGVLAYPTETVYGLGTGLDAAALERLAGSKGRERNRPFLLLAAAPRELAGLDWNGPARLLADAFWPGALSIAVAGDETFPPQVRTGTNSVAIRDTPLAPLRTLLLQLGTPLTSTSANVPGEPPATSLLELTDTLARLSLAGEVLVLDGGTLPPSSPSTIVDCSGARPRLVREGAIPLHELRTVLQQGGFSLDVA